MEQRAPMKRSKREASRFGGFTLIEVMITVAVIAILAAVALPSYIEYVTRSKLVEAKTNLSDMRTRLEQYFLDNRAYPNECRTYATGAPPAGVIYKPASIKNFAIDCAGLPAAYTVSATGLGFTFTIDQTNARQTTVVPAGWTTSTVCWVSRKNGDC
jgi:type IV pilus assembly protein PilE